MGFNNGYDAGWQDAINAVKYGKVPGLGPASGGGGGSASGGGEAVPATRAAGLFYITGNDVTLEIKFSTPALLSGDNISATELPATFTSDNGSPLARVTAPNGGWVPGDAILFYHNNSSLAGIDRGDTAPDDAACDNISAQDTDLMLMRLADTWTLIPTSSFG